MLIIRQVELEDAEAIARVHVDAWKTTYSGIFSAAYIERQSFEKRCDRWKKMLEANLRKLLTVGKI